MNNQLRGRGGHRTVFEADGGVIVEGWAPSRGGCLEELVRGFVSTLADTSNAVGVCELPVELGASRDEDVVAVLLDDIRSLLDLDALVVVDVALEEGHHDRFGGTFFVVPAEDVVRTGTGAPCVSSSSFQHASDGTLWHGSIHIND